MEIVNRTNIGLACLLLFVIGQAVRDTWLGHLVGKHGVFEIALVVFGTAVLLFTTLMLIAARSQLMLLARHCRLVLGVNLTTAAAWLCYFGALSRVEPTAANLMFSGIAPLSVSVLATLGLRASDLVPIGRSERVLHVCIGACLILLCWTIASRHSSLGGLSPARGVAGLSLAAASGIVITAESVLAKQMNERGISALAIVGVRFTLVALIALGVTTGGQNSLTPLSAGEIATLCGICVAVLILPIYLAQLGLQFTSPLTSGVVLSFGPAAVLALQATHGGTLPSGWMLFVVAAYAACSLLSVLLRAARARKYAVSAIG
jgi:drug/metabolite transporter (DMT)-like permease